MHSPGLTTEKEHIVDSISSADCHQGQRIILTPASRHFQHVIQCILLTSPPKRNTLWTILVLLIATRGQRMILEDITSILCWLFIWIPTDCHQGTKDDFGGHHVDIVLAIWRFIRIPLCRCSNNWLSMLM